MVLVMARRRRSPILVAAALLLLFVCFTAGGVDAAVAGGGATICDTAKCGKGSCSEVPGPIPLITTGYNCTCDPGWLQPKVLNLTVPWAPCIVPDCPFDASCFNLSLALPKGIPITDPCVAINCGPGECKKGEGFSYSCECQPGYVNFLNLTAFPCIKNCAFGADCSRLGIGAPPPSSPPPPPSTAAPPPGSVSSRRLLHLLLSLVSLAMAVQVI